jgi:hypothetical protein
MQEKDWDRLTLPLAIILLATLAIGGLFMQVLRPHLATARTALVFPGPVLIGAVFGFFISGGRRTDASPEGSGDWLYLASWITAVLMALASAVMWMLPWGAM